MNLNKNLCELIKIAIKKPIQIKMKIGIQIQNFSDLPLSTNSIGTIWIITGMFLNITVKKVLKTQKNPTKILKNYLLVLPTLERRKKIT